MKRIISAVLLLLLCLSICVASDLITESKAKELIEMLNTIEVDLKNEDFEDALIQIKRIENEWEKTEKIFSSISETQLIDELSLTFSSLGNYIDSKETSQAIIAIEECRSSLEIIYQYQKITIDNIL